MAVEMYNRDCMELMAEYPDKHFDLAIVDPPYGIGMGGGQWGNSRKTFKNFHGGDRAIPSAEYFKELMRVSENYIIWGGNYMTEHLPPSACFIVWDKVQPAKFTMAMAELAVTSFNSPAKIFKHRVVGGLDGGKIHPTQKPSRLYRWLLSNYAKEGDKILDTHGGSGSICIACHDLKFDLVWTELDKDYYDAALKRFNAHAAQLTLL
jgi:site-specific DNA-methyltransferase (adenine-specific)